jgi:ABC-type enterobactin transport system permease subunit
MVLLNTSGFPYGAAVNLALATAALVWYFRRQCPIETRAKVFRWVMVGIGIALFVYGNASSAWSSGKFSKANTVRF